MISQSEISKLLTDQLLNAGSQWSMGTFGGIAEFYRNVGEPVKLTTQESAVAAVTERGGIAVRNPEGLLLFASESITRLNWSHRVPLCLPGDGCALNRRHALTGLGTYADAIRTE